MNRKMIVDKLKGRLISFGRVTMPNMCTLPSPKFHSELARFAMDTSIKLLNIIAPRHHAKSSVIAAMLPLYHLMYDEGPKVVVLSSKTLGHSQNLLQTVKDVLDYSLPFRQLFGYWGQHSAKVWTKDLIILKNGDVVVAKGTGQQIHGMKFGNQRPTLFILDDPEDENNTKTAEAMEFNLRWLLQAVIPALDAHRGRCIVVGTPEHQRCIVETLKDSRDWQTLHYSAMNPIEGVADNLPEKERYSALWPELLDMDTLIAKREALKDIGRVSIFYRQYMCEVIGDEEQLFGADGIQYWDGVFTKTGDRQGYLTINSINEKIYAPPMKIVCYCFTGVDPASSTEAHRDYSTVVTIAVTADGNKYILPYYRARVKPLTLAAEILNRDDQYIPKKTYIESTGYQEMLKDYVQEQRFIPGIGVSSAITKPRMQKSKRLEAMQPDFFKRKFFLLRNMHDLENEFLMYPYGAHDDLLDGLYYAWKASYKPFETEVIIQKESYRKENDYLDGWML